MLKSEGGAINLTHDPAALNKWMIYGLEIQRLLGKFNAGQKFKGSSRHHE